MSRGAVHIQPLRAALDAVGVIGVLGALLLPGRYAIAATTFALVATGPLWLARVHSAREEWLRSDGGVSGLIGDFLRARGAALFAWAASVAVGMWVVMWLRGLERATAYGEFASYLLLAIAGASVIGALATRGLGSDRAIGRIAGEMRVPPLAVLHQQARDFHGRHLRTYIRSLVYLAIRTTIGLVAYVLLAVVPITLGLWELKWHPPHLFGPYPSTLLLGVGLVWWAWVYLTSSARLCLLMIAEELRTMGGVSATRVSELYNRALATTGMTATILAAFAKGAACAMMAFGAVGAAQYFTEWGAPVPLAWGVAIPLFIGLYLLLFSWPAMWVLPLMVRHDCGWVRAFEASTRLAFLLGWRGFLVGIASTVSNALIVGVPTSDYLRLATLQDYETLARYFLREMTARQFLEANRAADSERDEPMALRHAREALEAGRYLDALNAYQMFLRESPENRLAMRGEVWALLSIGSLHEARARLMRWTALDPADPEPAGLLVEVDAGAWSEGGMRRQAAATRCTQPLGVGVMPRDTI